MIGWNSEQQIWIRREARPHCALRSVSNARKIDAEFKQIQDDLKMNVWHPPAVFIRHAHSRKFFSTPNALPWFQRSNSFLRQMAVQREESLTVTRVVLQNDERSVVLRRRIVGHDVDHAIQGCAQPCPRFDE